MCDCQSITLFLLYFYFYFAKGVSQWIWKCTKRGWTWKKEIEIKKKKQLKVNGDLWGGKNEWVGIYGWKRLAGEGREAGGINRSLMFTWILQGARTSLSGGGGGGGGRRRVSLGLRMTMSQKGRDRQCRSHRRQLRRGSGPHSRRCQGRCFGPWHSAGVIKGYEYGIDRRRGEILDETFRHGGCSRHLPHRVAERCLQPDFFTTLR